MNDHLYIIIMAGGKGTRFWPLSRAKMPKQLLSITSKRTMIQETVDRILPIIPLQRIMVVTTYLHTEEIRLQLPDLPCENMLVEPIGRNTAPCIGLAASHLVRRDPDAVMAVLPADHLIEDAANFQSRLLVAAKIARKQSSLVTIGITPTRPETGYGYIQLGREVNSIDDEPFYEAKSFREKPNVETAEEFIKAGNFLWNSGMFIWRASSIMANIERYLPTMYKQLIRIRVAIDTESEYKVLNHIYPEIEPISIDFGVMERANHVYIIRGEFGWSDVGSWNALKAVWSNDENDNAVYGKPTVAINSAHSIIYSPQKVVALVNVNDLIVVETDDALLVCHKEKAQDVKKVVEILEAKGMKNLL